MRLFAPTVGWRRAFSNRSSDLRRSRIRRPDVAALVELLEKRELMALGDPTATVLSGSPSPSAYGQAVTFTATVSLTTRSDYDPAGTVEIFDGATNIHTLTLNSDGLIDGVSSGTVQISNLSVGSHALTAKYLVHPPTLGSTSSITTHVVTIGHLTITPDDQSREYGEINPTLSYMITGFAPGETLGTSDVTGTPSITTTATATTPVLGSPYTITSAAGTLQSNNYDFTYKTGTLTITPAPLSVGIINPSRGYGEENPAFVAVYNGFKNNETLATSDLTGTPSISTTADALSPVGDYPVSVSSGTLSTSNYVPTFEDGTLTVNPASLFVVADDVHVDRLGATPVLTYHYQGFVNNQTSAVVTGTPTLSTTGGPATPAGSYAIHVDTNSMSAPNYVITGTAGVLTVHPVVTDVRVKWGTRSMSIVGLNRPLPFSNITAIDVIFSDPVNSLSSSLHLNGQIGGPKPFNSYGTGANSGTWGRAALTLDRYQLSLDQIGLSSDPSVTLGGSRDWQFSVLPGDFNGDGTVNTLDSVAIRNVFIPPPGTNSIWGDMNGDGKVDNTDLSYVRSKNGTKLPPLLA